MPKKIFSDIFPFHSILYPIFFRYFLVGCDCACVLSKNEHCYSGLEARGRHFSFYLFRDLTTQKSKNDFFSFFTERSPSWPRKGRFIVDYTNAWKKSSFPYPLLSSSSKLVEHGQSDFLLCSLVWCGTPRGGGVLPYKRLMGMCGWIGSHFHDWIDYNGVTFVVELPEWGRTFSGFLG